MTCSPPATTSGSRAGAVSKQVADYLRDAILGGDIWPGEHVRQEEVAERFGASRLPVREALRMLEAEGLIEHERNKGARVPVSTCTRSTSSTRCENVSNLSRSAKASRI